MSKSNSNFGNRKIQQLLAKYDMPADKLEDAANELCKLHSVDYESICEERDQYKADAEKLPKVEEQLKKATADYEAVKKYETMYNDINAEHEKLKTEISTKAAKEKADAAIIEWAKSKGYSEAGAKKIAKYGGYGERIKFDEDGKPTNLDELESDVAAEWGEYKGETKTETHKETNPMTGGATPKQSLAAKYYTEYQNRLYGTKTAAESGGDNSDKEG